MVTLEEQLDKNFGSDGHGWKVSKELFGNVGIDIYDFEMSNYIFFLDNVATLEDLIRGLQELSPLVDDALAIAKKMNEKDFYRFRKALPRERASALIDGQSHMSNKFQGLLLPQLILSSMFLVEEFQVALGVMMITILAEREKLI